MQILTYTHEFNIYFLFSQAPSSSLFSKLFFNIFSFLNKNLCVWWRTRRRRERSKQEEDFKQRKRIKKEKNYSCIWWELERETRMRKYQRRAVQWGTKKMS